MNLKIFSKFLFTFGLILFSNPLFANSCIIERHNELNESSIQLNGQWIGLFGGANEAEDANAFAISLARFGICDYKNIEVQQEVTTPYICFTSETPALEVGDVYWPSTTIVVKMNVLTSEQETVKVSVDGHRDQAIAYGDRLAALGQCLFTPPETVQPENREEAASLLSWVMQPHESL